MSALTLTQTGHQPVTVYATPPHLGDRLALRAAVVFDGTGAPPRRNTLVLVEGGRVHAVEPARAVGTLDDGWRVLDFSNHTLLPGLIDSHTHLMLVGDGRPIETIIDETDELLVLRSARNAATTLAGGITTVRDLGSRNQVAFSLRAVVEQGLLPSPRLLLSGRPITMTGGHCHFFGGECDGPDGVRATARQRLKEGADVLKIMATGGLTRGTGHHVPGLTTEEIVVAVEEARRVGRPTTAHASSMAGMRAALAAGIDCIEHAAFLDAAGVLTYDERLADEVARAGVYVSPTLQEAYRGLAPLECAPDILGSAQQAEIEALRARKLGNIENAARLRAAGVRLIVGSDAGSRVTPHGDLAFGVELMARTGMSVAEAIAAGTGVAAQAAGLGSLVGTLGPGKLADLLVVDGDVSEDIRALARVRAVFQAGELVAEAVDVRTEMGHAG